MTKQTAYKANSPAAYNDVKYVMDLALKRPGLRYEFKAHGTAVNFKQRANRYRNLLREQQQELYHQVPGQRASTIYDALVIRQVNEEGEPDRKGCVLVFDHHSVEGKLVDPETGEEIQFDLPSLFSGDEE